MKNNFFKINDEMVRVRFISRYRNENEYAILRSGHWRDEDEMRICVMDDGSFKYDEMKSDFHCLCIAAFKDRERQEYETWKIENKHIFAGE